MNDDTLEERISLRLKPLNVFVTVGMTILFLITITTFLIAFTPLREYIPTHQTEAGWRPIRAENEAQAGGRTA